MTVSAADASSIARALLAARRSGKPMITPSIALDDTADAYKIQQAVAQQHGAIDGWKVGARSPDTLPTCAPLLGGTVIERLDRPGPSILVAGAVGIEVEIAYRINRDFAAGSAVRDEEVLEAIASAHIAVELCASRLAEGAQAAPLWVLADNQVNERLVVGPCLASWRALEPAAVSARVLVNGGVLVSTIGGHPARDPLRLLLWLARHCAEHRGGLRTGQIVTTGSWIGMPIVTPAAQISAEFVGLGSFTFNISHR